MWLGELKNQIRTNVNLTDQLLARQKICPKNVASTMLTAKI